ncbi:hypothetical protein FOL47_003384 [Perkinsus chesapeaki]|uniref:Adenylosuccinate synthetase n=1 Tax=Perkinsus chesapeaki TaxID=330153 RepID=A0A7J6M8H4_PERCH|nr:hypothetical protein FOL47_003384 [Perkinsus chesapeaki]
MSSLPSTSNESLCGLDSSFTVILGTQWGDEGKGKLVDILAQRASLCARFNGGANAGHTLVVDGQKFAFHLLPCGIVNKKCDNLVGNGVVLHVPTLLKELEQLKDYDGEAIKRLYLSNRASLLFDAHQMIDGIQEAEKNTTAIGTTKRGIGPCYANKTTRNGLRVGDLLDLPSFDRKLRELLEWCQVRYNIELDIESEIKRYHGYAEILKGQIVDGVTTMHKAIQKSQREDYNILVEAANATMLDIDFGTYPYVTSSNTTIGGVCTGLGVPPQAIQCIIGVVKAYTTRVGGGPFPTELFDEYGTQLREQGHEYGTTTGRPRRCGWLDIPVLKYSNFINGFTSFNVTKLDVLSGMEKLLVCTAYEIDGKVLEDGYYPSTIEELEKVKPVYTEMQPWKEDISNVKSFEELPEAAQTYIEALEKWTGVPVSWIGVGPGRQDMIRRHTE